MKPKIKIITGSTRPGRFNIQPATWIYEVAKKREDIDVELVDLHVINLPFLDESTPPLMKKYTKEHTKQWSNIVADGDGFIWVTPEYNHSYSPVLKNAIDFVFHEWSYKPVSFVSYGAEAGGSRAVEHLRAIAGQLKMYDLQEQVLLPNYWKDLDENGVFQLQDGHEHAAQAMLETLVFWAKHMKNARKELEKVSK